MSINSYAYFEELYAGVKPIRGRSEQVRPIGKRHRDWEQVVRRVQADGSASYAVRLYQTDVVEYYPNGDVVVRTGGWQTPSTAEFIHAHGPFTCWKQNNKVWVRVRGTTDEPEVYPVRGELRFKQVGEHKYEPAEPVVIHKKVVNREKAKLAREPLKPFMKWAKTFLTMSDGWVMHETCKEEEALGWSEDNQGYITRGMSVGTVYEMLTRQREVEPETVYLTALCVLAQFHMPRLETRVAQTYHLPPPASPPWGSKRFVDVRTDFSDLQSTLHTWLRKHGDVHQIVQVEPGGKAIHGVV